MWKVWALAIVLTMATPVLAVDACNPCPPPEKWIDVCETVQVQVPVTVYVDEPCEVQVTRMVPQVEEVPCFVNQWTFETREVCETKKVYDCEEYTVQVPRYETRCETKIRKVPQVITETVERTVVDKVCEEVCDPITGQIRSVTRDVCRTVAVPVKRKVYVDQEYQVNTRVKVMVPELRTRQVARNVQVTKQVRVPKQIRVPSTKKVTVMRPVTETKTVMRKKAVCTTQTVERQVMRKVRVPVEPPC